MRRLLALAALSCLSVSGDPVAGEPSSFTHWETPHVHPLDKTPGGTRLLAVNTADNRLEIFDVESGAPVHVGSVPVGLDPVSVRARTDQEAWVVNHVSDSISVVDLTARNVVRTIRTDDEPADVVFAGSPARAFVSCSQVNKVQVFDPENPSTTSIEIPLEAEDPRAMAVSPDGSKVYVAIFESGNRTTVLGGGASTAGFFPPKVVNDPLGPYGGVNPPPNSGNGFDPPMNPDNPPPPAVSLIVRRSPGGAWLDDNGGDWTDLVSGDNAALSGRPVGWDLLDHDLAVVDASTLSVTYASGLMNLCMAVAVNPATGQVTVVGTEATNEIRFEPKLNGRFLRVRLGIVDPGGQGSPLVSDLNPHLTYELSSIPQDQRELSLGDPRSIVWNSHGTRGYVAGMGSNNLVTIDAAGNRVGNPLTIELGEGPTGLALDEVRGRLYVLNKFEASISVVDTVAETELGRVPFHDPSPAVVKAGRVHLYGTHETSGLGHIACASCHPDARIDRLAWDLGNPAGDVKPFNQNCNFGSDGPDPLDGFEFLGPGPCLDWHPMKGPMMTQTLQDIIGKEPHHWRGDRDGLEEFNQTFMNLQGDDALLTDEQMQEFEGFLATIHLPPNPFRNFDNTLPTNLPLPGQFYAGVGGPAGQPLINGNAAAAVAPFEDHHLIASLGISCSECHTMPTGMGTNDVMTVPEVGPPTFEPFPVGPNGELHHAVVRSPLSETPHLSMKVPQLRNLHEKVGFEMTQTSSRAGFGFLHDGSVDSLARFLGEPPFIIDVGIDGPPEQMVPNLVAFLMSLSGSDLNVCHGVPTGPCGPLSRDTHAAVGRQITVDGENRDEPGTAALIDQMMALADEDPEAGPPGPAVGLVAKGLSAGLQRGFTYLGDDLFQSDRLAETRSADGLRLSADAGSELTFTLVPSGSEGRIGIDRDEDGALDRDELDACSDPVDPESIPDLDLAVPRLLVGRSGGDVVLLWDAVGASWDVVHGDLETLRGTAGEFTAATTGCLADDTAQPSLALPGPSVPSSAFFLVRAACPGGTTYESGGTSQVGVRDDEIDASPLSCPGP